MISDGSAPFLVVGANHRSASLSLRDQLFVDDDTAGIFLDDLRRRGLDDCLILSTCDRVEIWACHADPDLGEMLAVQALADRARQMPSALLPHLYRHHGDGAVRHAFAVTAALDSLIIGEPQVAGQVKAAHRLARDGGMVGGGLDQVLQAAFAAAKHIRSDTAIGEGPVSIAAAAVQQARDLHGDLSKVRGLLIGAGDMGELVGQSLLEAGLGGLSVSAPRQSRAEALAQVLNAHVVGFDDLRDALPQADVVVSAVGGRHVILTADQVTQALKKRRRRPVFLVDAGIPGDIEPAVNRVDGAFLYDLNDLEQVAMAGRSGREQAARAAWAVLEQEVDAFHKARAGRAAVPAIVSLRERFDLIRQEVLSESGLDADRATRLLVNRLLHAPSETMKTIAAEGQEWQAMEKTLRCLFRLD